MGNTVRTLRRGNVDDITDPRQAPAAGRSLSTLVLALVTDWLFPLFSAMMFAVVMLTQA